MKSLQVGQKTQSKQLLIRSSKSNGTSLSLKKKKKRIVEVVACGAAFPVSSSERAPRTTPSKQQQQEHQNEKKRQLSELDFQEVAQEIRQLGATMFLGKSKREYEEEEYIRLTGRKPKRIATPVKIVRQIKKKQAEREAKDLRKAKEAGIVLPKKTAKKRAFDKTARIHGPAPSVGFMQKGVLRVSKKP